MSATLCASCFWIEKRDANKGSSHSVVSRGHLGEHIMTNSRSQPPTVPLPARACSRSRPTASLIFWILWPGFAPTATAFFQTGSGWPHLGGARMVGRVPKRAMQASSGTARPQLRSWRQTQPLVSRGNGHRTNPFHAPPHDPWLLTQRSRVSTPTAQVPRVRVPDFATLDQQQQIWLMEH